MTMLLVAYLKRYKEPVSLKGKCIWEGTQWAIMFLLVYQGIFHFWEIGCTAFHEAGLFAPDGTVGPCYQ